MKAKTPAAKQHKTAVVVKSKKSAKNKVDPDTPMHARPSLGDPDREQDLPMDGQLPDLDNDTVHKTARPDGPILEDDNPNDELAEEHQTDRDEDVSEGNPLHVGHYAGR
ncbi:MAG: hypothetical protein ABIR28_13265 [Vicinamibacteria bacterium]